VKAAATSSNAVSVPRCPSAAAPSACRCPGPPTRPPSHRSRPTAPQSQIPIVPFLSMSSARDGDSPQGWHPTAPAPPPRTKPPPKAWAACPSPGCKPRGRRRQTLFPIPVMGKKPPPKVGATRHQPVEKPAVSIGFMPRAAPTFGGGSLGGGGEKRARLHNPGFTPRAKACRPRLRRGLVVGGREVGHGCITLGWHSGFHATAL